jgi:hypothetical protein
MMLWSETPEAKCPPGEAVHSLNGDTNLYSFDYLQNMSNTAKKRRFEHFSPYGWSPHIKGYSP